MSNIAVGDRVSWQAKGETRTGTVELVPLNSDYVDLVLCHYIKPDSGRRRWVRKDQLTKIAKVQP